MPHGMGEKKNHYLSKEHISSLSLSLLNLPLKARERKKKKRKFRSVWTRRSSHGSVPSFLLFPVSQSSSFREIDVIKQVFCESMLKNSEKFYSHMFVDSIVRADDKVLEITLHKMIVHCTNLPFEFRQKSADWLLDKGFRLDIGGAE